MSKQTVTVELSREDRALLRGILGALRAANPPVAGTGEPKRLVEPLTEAEAGFTIDPAALKILQGYDPSELGQPNHGKASV